MPHPGLLATAGAIFLLGALPAHLRARGVRGTWAVHPRWLVTIGVALLLTAAISAALG